MANGPGMGLTRSDPLGAFLGGQQAGIQNQRQRLALQQEQQRAPIQNQLGQLQLQGAQLGQQQAQRQAGVGKEQEMLQFLGKFGEAMEQIPTIEGRLAAAQRLAPMAEAVGVDPVEAFTPEHLSNEGLQELRSTVGGFIANPESLTAAQREFQSLSKGLTQEDQERARRIRLGLDRRAGVTAEEIGQRERRKLEAQQDLAGQVQKEKVRGKKIAESEAVSITEGREAAKGIPVLRRSLSLLDEIKTGGLRAVAIKAKQLFGIEGADEGELSANLGQAVLGDLRATFGAAFTEKEGARLERIRANLGRSAVANRRLISQALQISERAADRAIDDAIEAGDTRTAEEIQSLLDFEIQDEVPQTPEAQPGSAQSISTQAEFDALPSGALFVEDGVTYRKP